MDSLINIGIILTYLMIAFAAITAISFGVKKIIANTQNTKNTLYTFGALLIVVIFAYLISSDKVLGSYEEYGITKSTAKQVGMGLTTFYILAIGAVGAVLYAELSKLFSK